MKNSKTLQLKENSENVNDSQDEEYRDDATLVKSPDDDDKDFIIDLTGSDKERTATDENTHAIKNDNDEIIEIKEERDVSDDDEPLTKKRKTTARKKKKKTSTKKKSPKVTPYERNTLRLYEHHPELRNVFTDLKMHLPMSPKDPSSRMV